MEQHWQRVPLALAIKGKNLLWIPQHLPCSGGRSYLDNKPARRRCGGRRRMWLLQWWFRGEGGESRVQFVLGKTRNGKGIRVPTWTGIHWAAPQSCKNCIFNCRRFWLQNSLPNSLPCPGHRTNIFECFVKRKYNLVHVILMRVNLSRKPNQIFTAAQHVVIPMLW